MKIANFILGLITAAFLFAGDIMPLFLGSLSSLIGAVFYESAELDLEIANYAFASFGGTILILLLSIATIVLSVIAFIKRKSSKKTYTIFQSIICVLFAGGFATAIPVSGFADMILHTNNAYYAWPVVGFVLLAVMVVLTIVNGLIRN
ncbi:MAG: hypothetical protein J6U54_08045 [Clostridiales bacterium]|nr:hypothetical protein [Clostridiales bacterium]